MLGSTFSAMLAVRAYAPDFARPLLRQLGQVILLNLVFSVAVPGISLGSCPARRAA